MNELRKQLKLVAALLAEETTLALATSGEEGLAAVTPLFYINDEKLSLYWLSSEASPHSQNLTNEPRAAVTVYRKAESWRQIRGVQMRGLVSKVARPEGRRALLAAYGERFKLGRVLRLAIRQSALYEFQPDFIRYIDNARGFGYRFELTRQPGGWSLSRPAA
jgi:uncharacterized protein YhbP (UPF0306 family)